MRPSGLVWVLACVASSGTLLAQGREAAAFEKLRGLKGDWEGTYAWTGRNSSGKVEAHYSLTGAGSAVEENLVQDGTPSMTSVYHMDGGDLRMTHYCAAQNQPRLKATTFDPDGNGITFSFVDITNLRSPTAGHVDGVELKFPGQDHIVLRFRFTSDGKISNEEMDLRRAARPMSRKPVY